MSDTRDLYKLFRELESQHQVKDTVGLYDSFDLELNEHFVIESGVVGFTEDGVIIHLDEAGLEFLDFNGMLTESEEDYQYRDSGPTVPDEDIADMIRQRMINMEDMKPVIAKYGPIRIMAAIEDYAGDVNWREGEGISTKAPAHWAYYVAVNLERGDYNSKDTVPVNTEIKVEFPPWFRERHKEWFRNDQVDELEEMMVMGADSYASSAGSKTLGEGSSQHVADALRRRIFTQHLDVLDKYGPVRVEAAIEHQASSLDDLGEIGSSDTSNWVTDIIEDLESGDYNRYDTVPVNTEIKIKLPDRTRNDQVDESEDSDIFAKVLASEDPFQVVYDGYQGNLGDAAKLKIEALFDAVVDANPRFSLNPSRNFEEIIHRVVDRIENPGSSQKPFRADTGNDDLTEIKRLAFGHNEVDEGLGKALLGGTALGEAEYQGRKVTLNKPMQGDVAKSKVYVKKPNGKVVKVNFGAKGMTIKKSNPARRKSFRARHNCKNPGPKWKARYWSCGKW